MPNDSNHQRDEGVQNFLLQLRLDQQQAYQTKSTKQLLPMNQGHGSKTKATKGLFVKRNQQRLNAKLIVLFLCIKGFLPRSMGSIVQRNQQPNIEGLAHVCQRCPSSV